jgi:hypothetical protein
MQYYITHIKCNKIMMIPKMQIDNRKGHNGVGNFIWNVMTVQ